MDPTGTLLGRRSLALLACLGLLPANRLPASEPLLVHSANGQHMASADSLGRISYHPAGGSTLANIFYICEPQTLAFSEDGSLLAAAGGGNGSPATLKVWRISDRKQLCEIAIGSNPVLALTFSPDGSSIAGSLAAQRVAVWRISTRERMWVRNVSHVPEAVRFSVDGRLILVRGADGRERRLNAANGRFIPPDRAEH